MGTGAGVEINIFSVFSTNVNTINRKIFPIHDGISKFKEI